MQKKFIILVIVQFKIVSNFFHIKILKENSGDKLINANSRKFCGIELFIKGSNSQNTLSTDLVCYFLNFFNIFDYLEIQLDNIKSVSYIHQNTLIFIAPQGSFVVSAAKGRGDIIEKFVFFFVFSVFPDFSRFPKSFENGSCFFSCCWWVSGGWLPCVSIYIWLNYRRTRSLFSKL